MPFHYLRVIQWIESVQLNTSRLKLLNLLSVWLEQVCGHSVEQLVDSHIHSLRAHGVQHGPEKWKVRSE